MLVLVLLLIAILGVLGYDVHCQSQGKPGVVPQLRQYLLKQLSEGEVSGKTNTDNNNVEVATARSAASVLDPTQMTTGSTRSRMPPGSWEEPKPNMMSPSRTPSTVSRACAASRASSTMTAVHPASSTMTAVTATDSTMTAVEQLTTPSTTTAVQPSLVESTTKAIMVSPADSTMTAVPVSAATSTMSPAATTPNYEPSPAVKSPAVIAPEAESKPDPTIPSEKEAPAASPPEKAVRMNTTTESPPRAEPIPPNPAIIPPTVPQPEPQKEKEDPTLLLSSHSLAFAQLNPRFQHPETYNDPEPPKKKKASKRSTRKKKNDKKSSSGSGSGSNESDQPPKKSKKKRKKGQPSSGSNSGEKKPKKQRKTSKKSKKKRLKRKSLGAISAERNSQ